MSYRPPFTNFNNINDQPSVSAEQILQQNEHARAMFAAINPSSQIILMMYGIPGCGKSTLAKRIVYELHPHNPYWVAINQDEVGTRKAVERHARDALASGYNVIIDRCNFDIEQRRHWIDLAWENSLHTQDRCKPFICCLVPPHHEDLPLCTRRALHRGNDGVHEAHTEWNNVCTRMKASLRYPRYEEGIDAIYHCETEEDIVQMLQTMAYMGCNHYAPLPSITKSTSATSFSAYPSTPLQTCISGGSLASMAPSPMSAASSAAMKNQKTETPFPSRHNSMYDDNSKDNQGDGGETTTTTNDREYRMMSDIFRQQRHK